MNFYDWLDTLDLELQITRYSQQNGRWTCQIKNSEIKGDGCLTSCYGTGKSALEATDNYLSKIRGKTLVINAMSSLPRKEFYVLEKLQLTSSPINHDMLL